MAETLVLNVTELKINQVSIYRNITLIQNTVSGLESQTSELASEQAVLETSVSDLDAKQQSLQSSTDA